jgi:rRNA methylase
MIRVSDAVGADSVIFAGEAVDPLGGKVVRASAGSLFHIPVARDASVTGTIKRVKAKGLTILAATADGEIDLDDAGDLLREPTAWLFGNEAHGLGEEAIAGADHLVRIPIRGRAESLNLATAAAICLYESAKAQHQAQRQAQQHAE